VRVGEPASLDVAAALPTGVRVVGTVAGLHDRTLVPVVYSRLAAKHRLQAWAKLLALTVTRPGVEWRAVTLGRGRGGTARAVLPPVDPEEARTALADLVAIHREGLREPLPLSMPCALAYAKARRLNTGIEDAEAAAEGEWRFEKEDESIIAVLGADPEFAALLAQRVEGGSRFGALAERIWRPLLAVEHLEVL
jgi:exodeoxyribonuclease V gamma subunit